MTTKNEETYNQTYYLANKKEILSRAKKRWKNLPPEEKERLRIYKRLKAREYKIKKQLKEQGF